MASELDYTGESLLGLAEVHVVVTTVFSLAMSVSRPSASRYKV